MATNEELNAAISEIANAVQVLAGLATRLRRDLSASAEHATAVEQAVDKAVVALKRLQPRPEGA